MALFLFQMCTEPYICVRIEVKTNVVLGLEAGLSVVLKRQKHIQYVKYHLSRKSQRQGHFDAKPHGNHTELI